MKAIVDENLPPRLALWLCARGWDAVHVLEMDFGGRKDREIWSRAVEWSAIVVTQDRDFFSLAGPHARARVLRLGLGNATPAQLLHWVEHRWPKIEEWAASETPLLDLARSWSRPLGEDAVTE